MMVQTIQPITTIDPKVAEAIVRGLKAQSSNQALHNALDKVLRELRRGIKFELIDSHLRVQSSRDADVMYDTDLDACDCEACLLYHTFCWHRGLLMVLVAVQPLVASVRAVFASPCPPSPYVRRSKRRSTQRGQQANGMSAAVYMTTPSA